MNTGLQASKIAVFRVDASARIGGGHVTRCLALADALTAEDWSCVFSVNADAMKIVPGLARYPVEPPLDAGRGPTGGCQLLVVDHYGLDSIWETTCRNWADRILVIDDAPNRLHDCDILLDTAPHLPTEAYTPLVPANCIRLLGPDYALLATNFAKRRSEMLLDQPARQAVHLFVNFGLTADAALYERVVDALGDPALGPDLAIEVDIVLGAAPDQAVAALKRRAADLGQSVRVHGAVTEIADLLAQCNIAIAAAGTSSWERCCLAVPSLVVSMADNQANNAAGLARLGAAIYLGTVDTVRAPDIAAALAGLARDSGRRRTMARRAALLCDGRGAARVVTRIDPSRARDLAPVSLRPAQLNDAAIILGWQRHPDTRRWFRNPQPPTAAEHADWIGRELDDPSSSFMVIEHNGSAMGTLRLSHGERAEAEISILVDPDSQGQGIGTAALQLAHRIFRSEQLVAEVHPDNHASQALFRRCGYHGTGHRLIYKSGNTSASTAAPLQVAGDI